MVSRFGLKINYERLNAKYKTIVEMEEIESEMKSG